MSKLTKCLILVSVLFLGLNLNPAYAGDKDPVPPIQELSSFLVMHDLFGMRPRIAVHGAGAVTARVMVKDPFESIPILNRIRQTFTRDLNKYGVPLPGLGPGFIVTFENNKHPR